MTCSPENSSEDWADRYFAAVVGSSKILNLLLDPDDGDDFLPPEKVWG